MSDVSGGGISPTEKALAADMRAQQAASKGTLARQVAAKEAFTESVEEAFNPFSADKKTQFKSLKERNREIPKEEKIAEQKKVHKTESSGDKARQREGKNPEMEARRLQNLRQAILAKAGQMNAEEMLEEVMESFTDPSLADEALDFLMETTEGEIQEQVAEAKEMLNNQFERQVKAGHNIGVESREAASEGADSPENLRNLYRDITGNPRAQNELFKELAGMYPFDRLKMVVKFLMSALGSDMKAKGPSIPRGELYRLMTETRVLQSILGVYMFFLDRMRLINNLFKRSGLPVPDELDFETLAQHFMELVEERYPSASKVLRMAAELGIDEEALSQIIVFGQYRDAIRETAPRIYENMQHRYDLLMAIIEALDELEDELEDQEEEDGTV